MVYIYEFYFVLLLCTCIQIDDIVEQFKKKKKEKIERRLFRFWLTTYRTVKRNENEHSDQEIARC